MIPIKRIVAMSISMIMASSFVVKLNVQEKTDNSTVNAVDDDCNDDWLHVEGTNIVDKNGNKVWITGANWFGFNCRPLHLKLPIFMSFIRWFNIISHPSIIFHYF